ncbi:ISNCY family transposase [Paracoccus sp. MC1862]|uniref:ISNCY family transposase n=2 Tax=Paracoccus sp. MC1862 TaxID=2760307 RepID=UPI001909FC49|nr:ISNCY family transposase [Paracoccus sp. MC1862]QQO46608.1 ISNCY family transposase [Paracoccus sp. MC1862]
MGWLVMSERELNRIEVLSEVETGRLRAEDAAGLLGLTRRQVFRLLARFRADGPAGLAHRARGRAPNNALSALHREQVLALVRTQYADFGPTLAAEKLAELHDIHISHETLRKWMIEDGLWVSRKQQRVLHQPRLRREALGELVQIDGSEHRWFEDRGPACTLLVFIDDATGRLMHLRFVASESTFSYFNALEGYLQEHGRPVAFHSDKHSVFRVNRTEARSGHGMTQFGRALNELNIEILCANSSHAKGRVERANRTLQDRLVKELRLAGIADMAAGNTFLPGFIAAFNTRFARIPRRSDDLHRPLNVEPERLRDIFCLRDERHVGQQLALSYDRKRIILEPNHLTLGLVGTYVDTYEFPDGRLEIRARGVSLPYRMFDKEQRVTHAAITENKRLTEVLAFIQTQQDQDPPSARRVGKQRTRYEPKGTVGPGRTPLLVKARRAQVEARTN